MLLAAAMHFFGICPTVIYNHVGNEIIPYHYVENSRCTWTADREAPSHNWPKGSDRPVLKIE